MENGADACLCRKKDPEPEPEVCPKPDDGNKKEIQWMRRELETMLERIHQLENVLECNEQCPEEEEEEICEKNDEICELNKGSNAIWKRIEGLVRCLRLIRESIALFRRRMCAMSTDIEALQDFAAQYDQWKETISDKYGICIERFEDIKHIKVRKDKVADMINDINRKAAAIRKTLVTIKCVEKEELKIERTIQEAYDLFKKATEVFHSRFERIDDAIHVEELSPCSYP